MFHLTTILRLWGLESLGSGNRKGLENPGLEGGTRETWCKSLNLQGPQKFHLRMMGEGRSEQGKAFWSMIPNKMVKSVTFIETHANSCPTLGHVGLTS